MSFLDSVKRFFAGAGDAAAAAIDDFGQFSQRLQAIFDKWDTIKEAWDALFEPADVDEAGKTGVVTVFDAQSALETIRLGALKDRALQLYDDIKQIFNLAIHPIGGSTEGDKAVLEGAAAFAGKPGAGAGAFTAASLLNAVLNFEDRILDLEDKILELVSLLDIIQDMRNQIESSRLQQGNPQKREQLTIRRRM